MEQKENLIIRSEMSSLKKYVTRAIVSSVIATISVINAVLANINYNHATTLERIEAIEWYSFANVIVGVIGFPLIIFAVIQIVLYKNRKNVELIITDKMVYGKASKTNVKCDIFPIPLDELRKLTIWKNEIRIVCRAGQEALFVGITNTEEFEALMNGEFGNRIKEQNEQYLRRQAELTPMSQIMAGVNAYSNSLKENAKAAENRIRAQEIARGAAVGGLIGGETGAIVGAIIAKDKLDQKDK